MHGKQKNTFSVGEGRFLFVAFRFETMWTLYLLYFWPKSADSWVRSHKTHNKMHRTHKNVHTYKPHTNHTETETTHTHTHTNTQINIQIHRPTPAHH